MDLHSPAHNMPHTENATTISTVFNVLSWVFTIAFAVIGVLNMFLIHPVPGMFYLLLSIVYFPYTNAHLKKRLGFSIPPVVKVIIGFVIIWGTLAVGDLAELFSL